MDWRYNTIWFDQLDQSLIEDVDLRTATLPSLEDKEYVFLRGYRQENGLLDEFPVSDKIAYLNLNFNLKSDEVERELEEKSARPFREYVYKGEWQTFRYLTSENGA